MLISLEKVDFSYGSQTILENANWQIFPGQKIGLIGLNGKGKSTLFRIMAGQIQVDSGNINKIKNLSIGFLNQDSLEFESDKSILEVAMAAFEESEELEKRKNSLEKKLLENPHDEKLQEEFHEVLNLYEIHGGYERKHKSEILLEGLGFKTSELNQSFNTFSGGWRMRVLLAQLILKQPDLLLLDEPTNHLDLPAIQWLERYIKNYKGAMVTISHDREFLNQMCEELVELDRNDLTIYSGNYDFYETEKALRQDQLEKQYKNQQQYIKQQERFVERFKAKSSKAAQAQSIQKRLDKLDRIELDGPGDSSFSLRFAPGRQPGKTILELEDIGKSYGNKKLFDGATAQIDRGQKIGLVGANGVGKTTLLNIIGEQLEHEGKVKYGHHVDPVLYSQHQIESLHLENDILHELASAGSQHTEKELRQILGCFLFSGDDVFKKIKVLSGGEKSRVALAKVLVSSANFLLLDEPTNHLDMVSKDVLATALQNYDGSYIMVSHDRDFIKKTANEIWEIEDGKIISYPGTFEEWQIFKEKKEANKPAHQVSEQKNQSKKQNKTNYSQQEHKELKKTRNKYNQLEKNLEEIQSKEEKLLLELGDPDLYKDQVKWASTEEKYNSTKEQRVALEKEFEEIFEKLLELENKD